MADAVDHGIASATATTAWETAKGGVSGGFLGMLTGAVVGAVGIVGASVALFFPALAIAAVGALASLLIPSMSVGVGILSAFGATAAVGAVTGAITGVTYGSLGGTIAGLFKGSSRVAKEKGAYVEQGENHQIANAARLQAAAEAGAQQGYMMGRQQGQQEGVALAEKNYAENMKAIAARMGPAPQKSFAAAIDAERAMAAASPGKVVG